MKSIKLTTAALALFSLVSSVNAQTAEDYAAVAEFLPAEKLVSIQENGAKYAEYAYLNRHGYYLSDFGEKDISIYPDLSQITSLYPSLPTINQEMVENNTLNLMGYNFPIKQNEYLYYRIDSSNKLLVILPQSLSLKNLNSE